MLVKLSKLLEIKKFDNETNIVLRNIFSLKKYDEASNII